MKNKNTMQNLKGYLEKWIGLSEKLLLLSLTSIGAQIAFWIAFAQDKDQTPTSFFITLGVVGGLGNFGVIVFLFIFLTKKIKQYGDLQ